MSIKIFCYICGEHILNTTDKFKSGGPYNGSMFDVANDDPNYGAYFSFEKGTTEGNLWCPRNIEHGFVRGDGVLLTEHGLIRKGQETIDKSISLLHAEGEFKGRLKYTDIWNDKKADYLRKTLKSKEIEREPEENPIVEPTKRKFTCKKCGKPMAFGAEHSMKGCG